MISTERVTQNFKLSELTYSAKAAANGWSNKPDQASLTNLEDMCYHLLEPLRKHLGCPINISSGYRSPAVNKAVKGVTSSAHMYGLAVDINCGTRYSSLALAKLVAKICEEHGLVFDQIIHEFDSWVHIGYKQPKTGKQRGQLLTINKRGTTAGLV